MLHEQMPSLKVCIHFPSPLPTTSSHFPSSTSRALAPQLAAHICRPNSVVVCRALTVPWAGARTSKRQELGGGHQKTSGESRSQLHQSGSFDRRYNTRHCFRRKENGTFYTDPAPDDKMSSCLMSPAIRCCPSSADSVVLTQWC